MKTLSGICRHFRLDSRSLALHRRIARIIMDRPAVIKKARMNIRRWKKAYSAEGAVVPDVFREWEEILAESTPAAIARIVVARSERAARLRQSSPFAGMLAPAVRNRILESFAD